MAGAKEIAQFIRANDFFLISTHVFPDGDNMGSTLALMEALKFMGKTCASFIQDSIPLVFQWMPGVEDVDTDLDEALKKLEGSEKPVLLILDSGDIHRMGSDMDGWIEANDGFQIANIDHHVSNTHFGTVNWVGPDYSSVGEMMYEILNELGVEITSSIAQNLYVSVYTDTGRFSFSNTSARSLRYASEFVAAGAKPVKAFFGVYANRSFESFRLQAESIKTLNRFLDGKGLYFYVDQKMLESTGTTLEDSEGFVDIVRTLRGFKIVAFFKEVGPEDIRVGVRAAVPIDASLLMSKFGGGGHPRAAGCSFRMPLQEAIETFVRETESAILSGEVKEKD